MTSEIQDLDRAPYVGPRPFERWHADRFCARTREVNEAFSLIVAHPVMLMYAQSGAGKTSLVNAGLIPLLKREELDVLPVARVYGHFPETHPLEEVTNPYVLNTLLSWARVEDDIGRLNRLSLARFLGAGCPLLCVDDLKDPARLAGVLLRDSHPLAGHLSQHLSDVTQQLLKKYDGSALPSARLQQALVDDLNGVLKGPPLYTEESYPTNGLPEETLKLTERRLRGPDLVGLNRRLLEAAFPGEIQPITFQAEQEYPAGEEEIPSPQVAIFDQFEELFTSYGERWQDREPFFWQVGHALEWDPCLRVVFVMREEYVAQLDPYLPILPERLRTRLRIERLGKDTALQAIEEPLVKLKTGRSFAPRVAEGLVEQLLKVKAYGPDREVVWIEERYVEPVQLQVVCSRLWDGLLPDETVITKDHIQKFGDVDQALLEFYEDAITLVVEGDGAGEGKQITWSERWPTPPLGLIKRLRSAIRERKLRDWFEKELITPAGTRGTVFQGGDETGGIPNPVVRALDDIHLIRSEARAGASWYELTHDRFIEPIQESNHKRRETWKRLWETVVAGSLLVMAVLLLGMSWANQARAEKKAAATATAQAELNALAQQAMIVTDSQLDLALLLSLEASRRSDTFLARSGLLETLQRNPLLATFLHGHQDPVTGVAFSPDGQMLASADSGGTLVLWDVATGRELSRLEAAGATSALSVAFSPDGELLASGGCGESDPETGSCIQGDIRLWDVATGQEVSVLRGHAHEVSSVAFSPDGRVLASGSCGEVHPGSASCAQGEIRLWEVASGRGIASGHEHISEVVILTFSPDGQIVASVGADGTVALWDAPSLRPHASPLAGPDIGLLVAGVVFSPDSRQLALIGADGEIVVWDVPSGRPSSGNLAGADIESVAFSPHGQIMASVGAGGTITLWDVTTGLPLADPLSGHAGAVNSIAFSPDGSLLASGGYDTKVILWDVWQDSQLGVSLPGSQAAVRSVDFSPGGRMLAWGSNDGSIVLWDVENDGELHRLETPGATPVLSLAFSPDGEVLASGSCGEFDPETGSCIQGEVRLWDAATGEEIHSLRGHANEVWSVAFSPNGGVLASGGCGEIDPETGNCVQGEIRLWDAATREEIDSLRGHASEVRSVAFSPDGEMLASGNCGESDPETGSCIQGEVRLWNAATGEEIRSLRGHASEVSSVAFSPDGELLASGGCGEVSPADSSSCAAGVIRLWDVGTAEEIATLGGHTDEVLSVAFGPDGETLASTSLDRSIILWDMPSGQMLGPLLTSRPDVGRPVLSAAFSPDGQSLATGNDRGAVSLWDVGYESWQARACRRANRNMTQEEWSQYMGSDVPYQCSCPDLPCPLNEADSGGEP